MRKKNFNPPSRLQPSLFDGSDDYVDPAKAAFEFIPSAKVRELAEEQARARARAKVIDEMPPLTPSDRIFFMSFGSGSSGNCYYVGDRSSGFLIDAGVDASKVLKDLRDNGIMPEQLKGIILTHDHHDHISQVYPLLKAARHLKLYCTPRTLNGMLRRHNISRRIKDYHCPIYKEFPFRIGDFTLTPFEVLHDGADNVGYFLEHGLATLGVATDLGCISERTEFYLRQAHNLILESNYDRDRLREGSYPEQLKARILAANGHLDNNVGAFFVASFFTPALRNVFLCHLSADNNTPELAVEAYRKAFAPLGVSLHDEAIHPDAVPDPLHPRLAVIPLPRYERTPLYTL